MPNLRLKDWPSEYIDWLFDWWYKHGRPTAVVTQRTMPRADSLEYPSDFLPYHYAIPPIMVVGDWIRRIFIPRAEKIDFDASEKLNNALSDDKFAMLQRHIVVANRMQEIALDFLEQHKNDLGISNAVKLLIEGIRIERDSVGLPGSIERISKMSDERLMREIQVLIMNNSSISIENPEDNSDSSVVDADVVDVEDA